MTVSQDRFITLLSAGRLQLAAPLLSRNSFLTQTFGQGRDAVRVQLCNF